MNMKWSLLIFLIAANTLSSTALSQLEEDPQRKELSADRAKNPEELAPRKPLATKKTQDQENPLRNREKRRKGVNQKYEGYQKNETGDQPGLIAPGKDYQEKTN